MPDHQKRARITRVLHWKFSKSKKSVCVCRFCRRKADEVQILEDTIRARNEQHKKAGIEMDATCHICLKTKFADGVGHLCNYCSIRCCARCGGKVTLRSNKVILIPISKINISFRKTANIFHPLARPPLCTCATFAKRVQRTPAKSATKNIPDTNLD